MNGFSRRNILDRDDRRIIIHFDYDCFYAAVFEAENPALRSLPLAVQQKQIIVTCNYEARRRGLHKLQLVTAAKQACPEVIIVLGEDLTKFRNASKSLYEYLCQFVWSKRAERLGFDEVFLDVTDMIDFNEELLNANSLQQSFFQLSRSDPTLGFAFDGSTYWGHTFPAAGHEVSKTPQHEISSHDEWLQRRLLLGSHLAQYLRHKLEEDRGYTSTVGISTSKLISKLVGNVHKPKGQTTLVPPYRSSSNEESSISAFLDPHEIGKVPGVGFKQSQKIRTYMLGRPAEFDAGLVYGGTKENITVRDVRDFPDMGSERLEKILSGPGMPQGIGTKTWQLLNGVDHSEVIFARRVPKQISLEDSYIRLDTIGQVKRELTLLSTSLLKRMHIDLVESDSEQEGESGGQTMAWIAHPKVVRLSTRPRGPVQPDGTRARTFKRISRTAPIPSFLFSLTAPVEETVERLVKGTLLSMFKKLHPEKSGWNLSLINIAVTNMVEVASDRRDARSSNAPGRNIGTMFSETPDTSWKDTMTIDPVVVISTGDASGEAPSHRYESSEHEDDEWADGTYQIAAESPD